MKARLESEASPAYYRPMDNAPHPNPVPAGWLEALAESEAQLAAGETVPGATVRQGLRDSIARLAAGPAAEAQRGATQPP